VRDALNKQNAELPSGKLTGNNTELTVKNAVLTQPADEAAHEKRTKTPTTFLSR
jgi:multidrug efflux pump subunit AcrB